jgi:metal transporter CNNM
MSSSALQLRLVTAFIAVTLAWAAEEGAEKLSKSTLAVYLVLDVVLLGGAALFAGLTLSVMGLDTLSLEIIASSGQEPDKTHATKILPIRRKGNQLLCTLVLGNVMVNTLIAQITDRFVAGWLGVLVSTVLITLGGEIIPQATMAAHALKVGSSSAPIVKFFLVAFYPICKPLSMFLDRVIGNDPGQVYERAELRKLFALHAREHGAASGLHDSDVNLIFGAMDLGSVQVGDVMTPINEVFMLEASERLDGAQLQRIWQTGHSRIPVYKTLRSDIVGVLYAKDLLMVNPDEAARIHDFIKFHRRHIIAVNSETMSMAMLKEFQTGSSHIALVRRVTVRQNADPTYETVGIVTLDDVIGRLLGDDIHDDLNDREDESQSPPPLQPQAAGSPITHQHHHHGPILTAAAAALYGSPAARNDRTLGLVTGLALRLVRMPTITMNQRRAMVYFLRESVSPFASVSADALMDFVTSKGLVYEAMAPPNARGLVLTSRGNVWLYKTGHESTMFTLVLQGGVQVILPASRRQGGGGGDGKASEPLFMDLPPWSVLGTPVLHRAEVAGTASRSVPGAVGSGGGPYVPDFSARIVATSMVLQLHIKDIERFFAESAQRDLPDSTP